MPAPQMRSEATFDRHRGCAFLCIWLSRRLAVQNPALKIVPAARIPTWIALVIALAISGAAYSQEFRDAGERVIGHARVDQTTT